MTLWAIRNRESLDPAPNITIGIVIYGSAAALQSFLGDPRLRGKPQRRAACFCFDVRPHCREYSLGLTWRRRRCGALGS
jgi:hypothetical protein